MPWLRVGDSAATNPIVSEVREHPAADDRSKVEVFGFVCLCAVTAAQHLTDYVVSRATAADITGSMAMADRLLEQAVFAGYMEPVIEEVRGAQRQRWRIVEDPDFFHMRTEEEIEWERQRKRDNSNPALTVPVRLRDGDGCRYCGQVVNWRARRGRLGGTYDHRHPGAGAETIDDLVVACGGCNKGRQDNPNAEQDFPLLPAPTKPYYSPDTIAWIKGNDWAKSQGITPPPRPAKRYTPGTVPDGHHSPEPHTKAAGQDSAAEQASSDSSSAEAAVETSAAPAASSDPDSATSDDAAPEPGARETGADQVEDPTCRSEQIPAGRRYPDSDSPGRVGTGRDGSGWGGSPARPSAQGERPDLPRPHENSRPSQPARKRKRGRRGGRKK